MCSTVSLLCVNVVLLCNTVDSGEYLAPQCSDHTGLSVCLSVVACSSFIIKDPEGITHGVAEMLNQHFVQTSTLQFMVYTRKSKHISTDI